MAEATEAEARRLQRRGMERQARRGLPQGPVPLGYRNGRRDGEPCAEMSDLHALDIIRECFELAAEGWSVRRILEYATARGLRSRHGKELTPMSLHRILTNPFYCGMVRFGGTTRNGTHEPLLDAGTFWMAQGRLSRSSTSRNNSL